MADFYASYPFVGGGSGGGVPIYPSSSDFPATAPGGSLAVAADTNILYEYNATAGAWQPIASNAAYVNALGAVTTIGPIDTGSPSANGAHITANALIFQSASATFPGLVNLTTQSFAGNKTFTGTIVASNLSGTNTGDITIGTANGLSLVGQVLSLGLSSTSTTGALSSTDWNTFNGKQSALAFGNLTGGGFTVTGGTGAVIGSGASIAITPQNDIWVSRQGSDTTGNGSIANPFQTVGKALTLVTSPSSTNNWTIHLLSGRHDQEVGDLLIPIYTWIVGNGGPDVGSYLRLPAGKAIKLDSTWASSNGRAGIQSVYLGGGTSVNLDFVAGGGSFGSTFMFDDCFVTGTFTQTGRGVNGGDFIYVQDTVIFGAATFTGSQLESLNNTWASSITASTTSSIDSAITFLGGSVSGAFSFTQTGTAAASITSTGTSYLDTFTTVGTVSLEIDGNLPIGYSLSAGTVRTNTTDAKSLSYTPAVSGNWSPVPTEVSGALDQLAARSNATEYYVNLFTLSPTDISNKFVTLTNAPDTANKTQLTVVGGPMQDYGTDFTVTGSQLSWSGLFLDGVLVSGDKLIVQFN